MLIVEKFLNAEMHYSEAAQADVLIIFSHFCLCLIFVYLPHRL